MKNLELLETFLQTSCNAKLKINILETELDLILILLEEHWSKNLRFTISELYNNIRSLEIEIN